MRARSFCRRTGGGIRTGVVELFGPRLAVVNMLAGDGTVVGELMGLDAGEQFAAGSRRKGSGCRSKARSAAFGRDRHRPEESSSWSGADGRYLFGVNARSILSCFCRREWP